MNLIKSTKNASKDDPTLTFSYRIDTHEILQGAKFVELQ
jgi:hypothetical protein